MTLLFFGPRLDRPSAIGDEGRPRATSLTAAAITVLGLSAAMTFVVEMPGLVFGVVFLVSVMVAGAAILRKNRIGALVLGHLTFLPFASALFGLLVGIATVTPYGTLTVGFTLAILGITGSWTDVLNSEHVRSVGMQTLIAYVSMVAYFFAFAILGTIGLPVSILVAGFIDGVGPSASLVGFSLLLLMFCLSIRTALSMLPIVELAPASRRQAVAEQVTQWRGVATRMVLGCAGTAFILGFCWAIGILAQLYTVIPGTALLFGQLSSPYTAIPVVGVTVVCFVSAAVAWLIRRSTLKVDSSTRETAAVVAGIPLLIGMIPLTVEALGLPIYVGLMIGIVLTVAGPVATLVAIAVWVAMVEFSVLPDRASGPALAGTGLVVATIGAGLAGLPSPFVFACAAGALFVWDVSSFGLGVTAELGHLPETRRLELLHGVLGIGFGILAVIGVMGLDFLRTAVSSTVEVGPAATVAVIGVLMLLAPLRG